SLSKGTLKQLLWIGDGDLKKAGRMRFTPRGAKEGLDFLEAFVPYHLEKEPRSLKFLREIRR
ncbi:MAG TPA: DNA repair protein RecO C-terminal domain-containing protein, partial [Desulfobacterales bacterium]|nr:DNA repair protein RecO C-terminal domain-containing protein [Desulfobacterales bacterium]